MRDTCGRATCSTGSIRGGAVIRMAGVMTLVTLLGLGALPARAVCVGDCDASGAVTVDELVVMVNIALGTATIEQCPVGDADADGAVTVDEVIIGVNNLLDGCPPSPTPTATTAGTAAPTETPTPTATANGVLSVAEAVARDADGIALHLGQTVTTEGVVTVAAGIFANNKLKIFIQDGNAGIMVYHQSSADVAAFQPGQRLQVTGVIIQQDPTSDSNPATGTVAVDITQGASSVLSDGNPLPDPQPVTLATLNASGTAYTGTLVRVQGVHKTAGDWPAVGSKSTQVMISDDGGATALVLRLQRFTITADLVQALDAIGDGAFTLSGIVVQEDDTGNGTLLSGFEIWERGAADVQAE
jgi:hypothetical protein